MTVRALEAKTPNADPLREAIGLGSWRMIEPEVGDLPGAT